MPKIDEREKPYAADDVRDDHKQAWVILVRESTRK